MSTVEPPLDPEHAWRMAEPRIGKARLSRYLGRMRPGMVVDVTELRHERMVAWVETDWGLSRQMFCHHLDFGYQFRTRGGERYSRQGSHRGTSATTGASWMKKLS